MKCIVASSKVFSETPGQACYLIITYVFVPLQNSRLKTHYSPTDIGFDDFIIWYIPESLIWQIWKVTKVDQDVIRSMEWVHDLNN